MGFQFQQPPLNRLLLPLELTSQMFTLLPSSWAKPPTAYNIFRGGASVAAARHARATTHIPTSTSIHFDPKNNGSKSGNATRIIVDVAAERLIIFTKDEGMDEKTQKLMAAIRSVICKQAFSILFG
uniref:Uncharacterized protein n=1 Tax=Ditylenchus dipsaci TaxID=166011 RepID=A0A915CS54_9BILA